MFLTIALKLYKPSLNKRIIIDEAMANYARAFRYLLESAYNEIDTITERYVDGKGRYKASSISKWVDGDLDKDLNTFSIEPFKDSIKIDFAATIAGYLNARAKGKCVNYPSVYGHERPIFFCRCSSKRNYSLLYNAEKDRYYAKIYLMNVKNDKRKRPEKFEGKVLTYLNRNKDIFKEKGGKRSFLMFPLAFGGYQEKYLKDAMEKTDIIKTARLIRCKDQYFLSINILKENAEAISVVNYMGVARGLENVVNYSIVDGEGKLLFQDFEEKQSCIKVDKLHAIANHLVKVAKKNNCQVIMENIIGKNDRLSWKEADGKKYMPITNYIQYNELVNIMNYKLRSNGLPAVIKVGSIGIFHTCPYCGVNSKGNRFSKEMLMCISCGSTMDIEKVGSLNLARRLIKNKRDKIKIKVEETNRGLKFTNNDLDFEYYPSNPYDCSEEFLNEIEKSIKNFYDNIDEELKKSTFKKKYSLIKKIEGNKDIFQLT